MAMFPRFTDFKFAYERSYSIPPEFAGRLDLLAQDIYGDVRFYKPLAAANGLRGAFGMRNGIRTLRDAIQNDLTATDNVTSSVDDVIDGHNPGLLDWNYYGETASGYFTEAYAGRVINIPTLQNALAWLTQFERIQ